MLRLGAALRFFGGGAAVAFYSGYAAHVVQNPITEEYRMADLDQMFSFFPLVAGFPIMIVILVLMLRSWTWSAHDRFIHNQR